MKLVLSDPLGKMMSISLCCLLWYTEAIASKYFQSSGLLLLLGVLVLFFTLLDMMKYRVNIATFFPKPAYMILGYFVLTLMFGFFTSPDMSMHFSRGFSVIEYCIIMFCLIYYISSRGKVDFLLWNIVIMYTVMCVSFLIHPIAYNDTGTIRFSYGAMINPNAFSDGLSLAMWAVLFLISKKRINSFLGFALVGLLIMGSFNTGSKTGLITAVFVVALWIVLCYLPLSEKKSVFFYFGKVTVIVLVIIIAGFYLLPKFQDSVMFERALRLSSDESTLIRLDMYRKGLVYLKEAPIFGIGFWGFATKYGSYSHSTIIETLVSGGILISLLYFGAYFSILLKIIRNHKYIKLGGNDYYELVYNREMFILIAFFAVESISVIHFFQIPSFYFSAILLSYTVRAKSENLPAKIRKL